jgi:hypothetical protein
MAVPVMVADRGDAPRMNALMNIAHAEKDSFSAIRAPRP